MGNAKPSQRPGQKSLSRRVPAGVLSVAHSSLPCSESAAGNTIREPSEKPGRRMEFGEKLASLRVPEAVPSVTHRAEASRALVVKSRREPTIRLEFITISASREPRATSGTVPWVVPSLRQSQNREERGAVKTSV